MSVVSDVTQPILILPGGRRAGKLAGPTDWRYIYQKTVSGDGTAGSLTITVTPPTTLSQRNRLTVKAACYNDDTAAATATVRFRVYSGATPIYECLATPATGIVTRSLPFDQLPKDILVPDRVVSLQFEYQVTNTNLVAYDIRFDLLVEPFEQS